MYMKNGNDRRRAWDSIAYISIWRGG